jgi:hypothetical protein
VREVLSMGWESHIVEKGADLAYDRAYPIRVYVEGDTDDDGNLALNSREARDLSALLAALADGLDERDNRFVRVTFDNDGEAAVLARRYTYRDPSGTLVVGDRVVVPTRFMPEVEATVVARGRGDWDGETSDVIAKLERVAL